MTQGAQLEGQSFLTREQILGMDDIPEQELFVPEWGGKLLLRGLNGQQRDRYEGSLISVKGNDKSLKLDNARARLVQQTIVDPITKQPLFSIADIAALGRKSAAALDRVFSVSQKLSAVTDADMEELTKNSESDPNDNSGSN